MDARQGRLLNTNKLDASLFQNSFVGFAQSPNMQININISGSYPFILQARDADGRLFLGIGYWDSTNLTGAVNFLTSNTLSISVTKDSSNHGVFSFTHNRRIYLYVISGSLSVTIS